LNRQLKGELDLLLAPAGFRRVNLGRSFGDPYCREMSGVRHILGIGAKPYVETLEAEVGSASVRFNSVEDLVARFEDPHTLTTPEGIAARSTLGVLFSWSKPKPGDPLYSWGGTDSKVWLIHTPEEVPGAAREMAAFVSEKCEPVLAELSNSDHALTLLSGDDERSRSHSGPNAHRAQRAVALAFLLHGRAAAEEVAKVKLTRLKKDARLELGRWLERFRTGGELTESPTIHRRS
jgi:hypothetical protein